MLDIGEIGRGVKRRVDNAITGGKIRTRLCFHTRFSSSVTTAITPIPYLNPFLHRIASLIAAVAVAESSSYPNSYLVELCNDVRAYTLGGRSCE